MGSIIRRRLRQQLISRERAWFYIEANEAYLDRTISRSFGYDSPRETLSDWERLDYGDDGSLDETGE